MRLLPLPPLPLLLLLLPIILSVLGRADEAEERNDVREEAERKGENLKKEAEEDTASKKDLSGGKLESGKL